MSNSRWTLGICLGVLLVALGGTLGLASGDLEEPAEPSESASRPVEPDENLPRAFHADSWWNTPLPSDAPLNPAASSILEYMSTAPENGGGCLKLAGAVDGPWGQPIYWASPSDNSYEITGIELAMRPPELDRLRIPADAQPGDNNDGNMTVFDLDRGYVVALTDAEYDESDDEWSASGGTVTYLDSNGLHAATGRSDNLRNTGTHRGNNGATMAVRWDMFVEGEIPHVLKVALGPESAERFVFPMVGSDGDYEGDDPSVPPQGLRLRIKPSVNLADLKLHPEALVIAEALQKYGFYIGDSGGTTALKLENTVAEGRGQLWSVTADDLCELPFTPEYWDVIEEGYDPSS